MVYIRFAIFVVFILVGSIALWYRGEALSAVNERDAANAALSVAKTANEILTKTLNDIETRNKYNDELLSLMFDKVNQINDNMNETSSVIAELKEINEDVKAYMATSIPDDLRRVLNNQ